MAAPPAVKALFFDMFGTMLDWRGSVAREVEAVLGPLGHRLDWLDFADAWRKSAMAESNQPNSTYCKLDALHRRHLLAILPRFGIGALGDATIDHLNLCWHRLDAWPDVPAGLARLGSKFIIAPVSNGNISLMVDVARRNGFAFDAILGAELARAFKLKPVVYLTACEALDLAPGECMMVAAHMMDLSAAGALGLRTGFIHRPHEFGPDKGEPVPQLPVDVVASSTGDLADKLGA